MEYEKFDFKASLKQSHIEVKDLKFLQELEDLLREKDQQQQETAREQEAQMQKIQAERKDLLDEIATWQEERQKIQQEQLSKIEAERLELQKE